jgi:formate dehydrogenase iron-sulfur subunit
VTTFAYLLDMGRCIGCEACVAACKTGNELPGGVQYIHFGEKTTGTFPDIASNILNQRCMHCNDAACVAACPTGALYKEDGLTRLNREACSGCSYCVDACPFDVPHMFDGRSSKCDGCAAVVKAGGTPWCVKTCPSNALLYGEREEILAEARTRLAALKERYPNARIYGETEAGGLGVIMVLPDEPGAFDLPANPDVPLVMNAWQKAVQPMSAAVTGLSIAVTGVAAVIARRNHMKELEAIHRREAAGEQIDGAEATKRDSADKEQV